MDLPCASIHGFITWIVISFSRNLSLIVLASFLFSGRIYARWRSVSMRLHALFLIPIVSFVVLCSLRWLTVRVCDAGILSARRN
jgi:hypothetical protein